MSTSALLNNSPDSGIIDCDGFQLRYRIEGTGQPALVVGSSIFYPRTFSDQLRHHLQLIFMDHRGFAPAPGPVDVSAFELDFLVEDIERVRQALGLGQVIIVGHSGHGYMALEYAKKYPQNVSHVVLIGMAPNQGPESHAAADERFEKEASPERKAHFERNLAFLPKEIDEFPEKCFITFCIRLGARSWYDYAYDATPLWQGVEVNMPMFDYVWGEVFRDIDITKNLNKLNKPVFLGLGRYDYLVGPAKMWDPIKKKFKNLTMKIFEKSGHTPQLEESEVFDNALLSWLQENPAH